MAKTTKDSSRPLRVKTLPSSEELNEYFSYEEKTGLLVRAKSTSRNTKAGQKAGSQNGRGYLTVNFKGTTYYVHRLIWKMVYDYDPDQIDHINGVRDDNRLINLRDVSPKQNSINRLCKGYTFMSDIKKYRAVIWIEGKNRDIGYYETEEEAREAYVKEKIKLQGFCR